MWRADKAQDLQRDPRFALPQRIQGPARTGRATPRSSGGPWRSRIPSSSRASVTTAPPGPLHLFRADITELSVVHLGDPADHLVITSWHPGRGVAELTRT